MYYSWSAEVISWHNTLLQAELVPFIPDWFMIKTFNCAPYALPIPLVQFTFRKKAPLADLVWSSSTWEPYSPRLRALLRELGVRFEEFPCEILDRRSREVITDGYAVVHLLDCHPCMDVEKSDRSPGDPEKFVPPLIKSLVPTPQCDAAQYPLFRVSEATQIILASEATRRAMLDRQITGVSLRPSLQLNEGQTFLKRTGRGGDHV